MKFDSLTIITFSEAEKGFYIRLQENQKFNWVSTFGLRWVQAPNTERQIVITLSANAPKYYPSIMPHDSIIQLGFSYPDTQLRRRAVTWLT